MYIPPPPSLISLMVSVDVKHHVYLLTGRVGPICWLLRSVGVRESA